MILDTAPLPGPSVITRALKMEEGRRRDRSKGILGRLDSPLLALMEERAQKPRYSANL